MNKPGRHSDAPLNDNRKSVPETTSAYFLALELQGVRCFDETQRLDLSAGERRPSRWTIILGENGTGKTTLLQSLAAFERIPNPWKQKGGETVPRGFKEYASGPNWDRFDIARIGTGRDASLTLETAYASMALGWTYTRGVFRLEYRTKPTSSASYLSDPLETHEPPICYAYGAGRRMGSSTLDRRESDDATKSLFQDEAELINAEEWLLRIDYSASKPSEIQDQEQERLERVKHLLINILPDVKKIRFLPPSVRHRNPQVEFQTSDGWVPLRYLGYGYRTLITWMVDLASRMADRYPDSQDPLAEPAVVLVDEIDLHLHPRWQRELIRYLTDRFPNTQFIVTAHSPLIVQAASGVDANIALLKREGDHVVIENDVDVIRNWRVDQILTSDLFGLPSARPPELDKPLARRKELLAKPKLTKAEKAELARLEETIGTLPTGETAGQSREILDLVQESHRLLKEQRGRPR
jgi:predicted ATPase